MFSSNCAFRSLAVESHGPAVALSANASPNFAWPNAQECSEQSCVLDASAFAHHVAIGHQDIRRLCQASWERDRGEPVERHLHRRRP